MRDTGHRTGETKMATKTTKTTSSKAKTDGKKKAKATERPASSSVDPFAAPAPAAAATAAPKGDNVHKAPTDDEDFGNVAHDVAEYAAAKAEMKAAEARYEAAKGSVMGFAKRLLCGLISKGGSKPKGQKIVGEGDAVVCAYYQDRAVKVSDESYAMLCQMLGQGVVDAQIVETSKTFTVNPEKMADAALVAKMRKALQAALTNEELTGLFIPSGRTSRKGVVEQAAKLCDGDTAMIEQLLALTVPTPTVK